jgi:hypothetical protein
MPPRLSDKKFADVVGLTEAKRQLSELPKLVRREALKPIKASTDAIASAAREDAPRRSSNVIEGYSGGMLARSIVGRVSAKNLIGMVGIERGVIVVVGGKKALITKQVNVRQRRRMKNGTYRMNADGSFFETHGRRILSEGRRKDIKSAKGHVIQPTKYGHLMEFGTSRGVAPRSFLRPSVRRNQAGFETGLREVSADVIVALQQLGYARSTP